MKRDAVKDLLYGGIIELTRNKDFYYSSSVGSNYNHLTEEGKIALIEYAENIIRLIHRTEAEDIDSRAKKMVIEGLTKTN
jgi:hypothetical protein